MLLLVLTRVHRHNIVRGHKRASRISPHQLVQRKGRDHEGTRNYLNHEIVDTQGMRGAVKERERAGTNVVHTIDL